MRSGTLAIQPYIFSQAQLGGAREVTCPSSGLQPGAVGRPAQPRATRSHLAAPRSRDTTHQAASARATSRAALQASGDCCASARPACRRSISASMTRRGLL